MTETRRVFHEELDAIRADVIRLGALAGEAVEAATNAFLAADLTAVDKVVHDDQILDDLTHDLEQRICLLLAQQQPMAADLRMLVTVLRVIHEIERIGDLMAKVAKAARRLYPHGLEPRLRGLIDRMRDQAAAQLRLAIESFADRDIARAAALVDMDDVMDELQKELFQAIFSLRSPDDSTLQLGVQMALVGRYYERAGDHAANVADRVQFMVTGHFTFETAGQLGREPASRNPARRAGPDLGCQLSLHQGRSRGPVADPDRGRPDVGGRTGAGRRRALRHREVPVELAGLAHRHRPSRSSRTSFPSRCSRGARSA